MKLVMAIVSNEDRSAVSKALTNKHYYVTHLATTGGFLMAGNATLLVGVEEEHVDDVIDIIVHNSKKRTKMVSPVVSYSSSTIFPGAPVEVTVGGATIFVLDVLRYEKA